MLAEDADVINHLKEIMGSLSEKANLAIRVEERNKEIEKKREERAKMKMLLDKLWEDLTFRNSREPDTFTKVV